MGENANATLTLNFRDNASGPMGNAMRSLNQSIAMTNNKFDLMRHATTGVRNAISQLRNTLLLVTFAIGGITAISSLFIKSANAMQAAMEGLATVAVNKGVPRIAALGEAAKLTADGLLTVTEASAGLRNLLATGIGIDQAVKVMNALKDAAAFNRQGTLAMGEAVIGATQGFKNMLCCKANTKIYNWLDGEESTIQELHDNGKVPVITAVDRETGETKIIQASYIHYNGYTDVYRVELENGAYIETTDNHRFITKKGMKFLYELTEEDEILYMDQSKLEKQCTPKVVSIAKESTKQKKKPNDSVVENVQIIGNETDESTQTIILEKSAKSVNKNSTLSHTKKIQQDTAQENVWEDQKEEKRPTITQELKNCASIVEKNSKLNYTEKILQNSVPQNVLKNTEEDTEKLNVSSVEKDLQSNLPMQIWLSSVLGNAKVFGDPSTLSEEMQSIIKMENIATLSKLNALSAKKLLSQLDSLSGEEIKQLAQRNVQLLEKNSSLQHLTVFLLKSLVEQNQRTDQKCQTQKNINYGDIKSLYAIPFDVVDAVENLKETLRRITCSGGETFADSDSMYQTALPCVKSATSGFTKMCEVVLTSQKNITKAWIKIRKIFYVGQDDVYDLTVPDEHNFLSNSIFSSNSILVDNSGITKNLSIMWKEYAAQIGKTVGQLTDAEKYQAQVNGIIKEGSLFMGDAARASELFQGKTARLSNSMFELKAAIGELVQKYFGPFLDSVSKSVRDWTAWVKLNGEVIDTLVELGKKVATITLLVSGVRALTKSLLGLAAAFTTLNTVIAQNTGITKAGEVSAVLNLYSRQNTSKLAFELAEPMYTITPALNTAQKALQGFQKGLASTIAFLNQWALVIGLVTVAIYGLIKLLDKLIVTKKEQMVIDIKNLELQDKINKDLVSSTKVQIDNTKTAIYTLQQLNTQITSYEQRVSELKGKTDKAFSYEKANEVLTSLRVQREELIKTKGTLEDLKTAVTDYYVELDKRSKSSLELSLKLEQKRLELTVERAKNKLYTQTPFYTAEQQRRGISSETKPFGYTDKTPILSQQTTEEDLNRLLESNTYKFSKDQIALISSARESIAAINNLKDALGLYDNALVSNKDKIREVIEQIEDQIKLYGTAAKTTLTLGTSEDKITDSLSSLLDVAQKFNDSVTMGLTTFMAKLEDPKVANIDVLTKKIDELYGKVVEGAKSTAKEELDSFFFTFKEMINIQDQWAKAVKNTNEVITLDTKNQYSKMLQDIKEKQMTAAIAAEEKYVDSVLSKEKELFSDRTRLIKKTTENEDEANQKIKGFGQERVDALTDYENDILLNLENKFKTGLLKEEEYFNLRTTMAALFKNARNKMEDEILLSLIDKTEKGERALDNLYKKLREFQEDTLKSAEFKNISIVDKLIGFNPNEVTTKLKDIENKRISLIDEADRVLEKNSSEHFAAINQIEMNAHQQSQNLLQQDLTTKLGMYASYFENIIGGWQNLGTTIYATTSGVKAQYEDQLSSLTEMYAEGTISAQTFETERVKLSRAANNESAKLWKQWGIGLVSNLSSTIGKVLMEQGIAVVASQMVRKADATGQAAYFAQQSATWGMLAASMSLINPLLSAQMAGMSASFAAAATASAGASIGTGIAMVAAGAGLQALGGYMGSVGQNVSGGFDNYSTPSGDSSSGTEGRTLGSVISAREMQVTIAPVTNFIVDNGVLVIGNDASVDALQGTIDQLVVERINSALENGEIRV